MPTALIAEDEPLLLAQLKARLAEAWPELEIVAEAGNGGEALQRAEEMRPDVWVEAPNGRVKILDFGLARAAGTRSGLTYTGDVVGTPDFMSPEQARGKEVDARTDLFSLGAVLYVMASGQKPFQGDSVMAVLTALAVDTPRPVRELRPDVPPALAELIERLLAKDPADRFQSAAEVAELLAHQLAAIHPAAAPTLGLPAVRQRSGPLYGRRRPAERFWRLAALITWGVVGLVGAALATTELIGRTHLVAGLWRPAL